jgi:uncharacterized FlgJ-related protein
MNFITFKTRAKIWSFIFWRWCKRYRKELSIAGLMLLSFYVGTWYPNNNAQKQITTGPVEQLRKTAKSLGLAEPIMSYYNQNTFINAMSKCIDYVEFGLPRDQHIPKAIIIAMAMMESDNGSSRFAMEGNNLFGIRTWDPAEPQMKAYYQLNAKWGLKKYRTKCASVQDMVNILNTKDVHKEFRYERNRQMSKSTPDINKIVDRLDKWATNPNYRDGIKQIIEDNLKEIKD